MKKSIKLLFSGISAASVFAVGLGAKAFAPGSITVNGTDIPIAASGYVGYGGDDFAYASQAVIDTGAVASGVYQLNLNDGHNTHLMAHNPGTFSPIANTIHEGAKYVITDFNGVSKVYEFSYVGEVAGYATIPWHIENAIWGQDGEAITLQYCAYGTEIPQIWRGVPSEDQSLLNSQPAQVDLSTESNTAQVPQTASNEGEEENKSDEVEAQSPAHKDPVEIAAEVDEPIHWGQPVGHEVAQLLYLSIPGVVPGQE